MSRIGKKVILIPAGVTVSVDEANKVLVKGPKGELSFQFNKAITIAIEGNEIHCSRPNDEKENRQLHGTTRAVLANMVKGVTEEFKKQLVIEGVGYRASLKGNVVVIAAGYSHLVELPIPAGIKVEVPSQTELTISGIDKQVVGQFAAEIREVRKPEPYKGKGIRYIDEVIRRKEGKKAK